MMGAMRSLLLTTALCACTQEKPADDSRVVAADTDTDADTGAGGEEGCRPAGTWSFTLAGVPVAGEGCAWDGESAQPPWPHVMEVQVDSGGHVTADFTLPDYLGPAGMETTIEARGAEGACELRVTTGYFFELPVGGGREITRFAHELRLLQGADDTVSGDGSMHMTLTWTSPTTDASGTRHDCTEPLMLSGERVPAG